MLLEIEAKDVAELAKLSLEVVNTFKDKTSMAIALLKNYGPVLIEETRDRVVGNTHRHGVLKALLQGGPDAFNTLQTYEHLRKCLEPAA